MLLKMNKIYLLLLFLFIANYGFGDEMKRLDNQVVIITGASKGIGREMAKVFSREGAKLVLVARNEQLLKELVAELGDAIYVIADVRNEIEMTKVAEAALEKWEKLTDFLPMRGFVLRQSLRI